VRRLGSRLARMETKERTRLDAHLAGPALLIVDREAMIPADRLAFDGDDPEAKADAVERQTGQRPGRGTRLIVFTLHEDGPA